MLGIEDDWVDLGETMKCDVESIKVEPLINNKNNSISLNNKVSNKIRTNNTNRYVSSNYDRNFSMSI